MARVLVTRRLPDGGLDPLVDGGPRDRRSALTTRRSRTTSSCAAVADVDAHRVPAHRPDRRRRARRRACRDGCASSPTWRSATTTSTSRAATALGVAVCNTPGVLDETTADLAFLLILAASRLALDAEADLRAGRVGRLGHQPVPRARRARRDARARRLRPHRPGRRASRRRLRHAGAAPHPHRHRRCRVGAATSTGCSPECRRRAACTSRSPTRPAHLIDARRLAAA